VIAGVEHVAVSVSNLERSLEFYRDALGLAVARVVDCEADSLLGTVTAQPGTRARIAHLYTGSFMVELFEYREPRGAPIDGDRRQADLGLTHIGFRSTDARGDYEKLKKWGVSFLSEPIEFRPGVWLFYFRGPDGEVLELRES